MDPNPADEHPSEHAVEGKTGEKPAETPAQSRPKLVSALGDTKTQGEENAPAGSAAPPARELGGVSRGLFWLIAGLLVLAVLGLAVQGRQLGTLASQVRALEGQVEGLEVQLSAAHTQVQFYDMHLSLVGDTVGDLLERTSRLHELVNANPLAPATEPPEAP